MAISVAYLYFYYFPYFSFISIYSLRQAFVATGGNARASYISGINTNGLITPLLSPAYWPLWLVFSSRRQNQCQFNGRRHGDACFAGAI